MSFSRSQSLRSQAARFFNVDVLRLSYDQFVEWVRERLASSSVAVEVPTATADEFGLELWLADDQPVPDAHLNDDDDDDDETGRYVYEYELDLTSSEPLVSTLSRLDEPAVNPLPLVPNFCELLVDWKSDGTPVVRISQPPLLPRIDLFQSRKIFQEVQQVAQADEAAVLWAKKDFWNVRACVEAMSRRYSSLKKFGQALVSAQPEYFRHGHECGLGARRSLTRQALARVLGWESSVVCSAARAKWIRTPWGECLPVEKLLDGRGGERELVIECIKLIIQGEDVQRPLSDDVIGDLVHERTGIREARRTIAKRRQEAGYGSTRERRHKSLYV